MSKAQSKKTATVKKRARRAIGRKEEPILPPEESSFGKLVEDGTDTEEPPTAKEAEQVALPLDPPLQTQEPQTAYRAPSPTLTPEIEFPCELPIRVNVRLMQTINEFLEASYAGGDYTYVSFSAFVREALHDHMEGLIPIKEAQVEPGDKKRTSIRADEGIVAHWNTLPSRKRTDILERILRVKLKRLSLG